MPRAQRLLAGIIAVGAAGIAGIGFVGSYGSVRQLAARQGFGWFANVFPIGVDAGITVLLALDLFLTWKRIPLPLLRHTAWLLTSATVAFNAAAAWPRPLGVGMHATIPILFIVIVEAGRHAVGRLADITADRHMEPVRTARWLLAPLPTFRLWRRMKLWELRSYEEVVRREQDRLVYRIRLRARYGVNWRRRAPVEAVIPLRLARHGVPLAGPDTTPAPALSAADTGRVRPDTTPRTAPDKPSPAPPGQPRTALSASPDITADARADKGADTPLTSPDTVRPVMADSDADKPSVAALVRGCLDAGTDKPADVVSAVLAVRPDADIPTVKRTLRRERDKRTDYM
jgi:Protein of unknown function (DUF2637)